MKDTEVRRYDMLVRVRDFGATHAISFPANSLGGQLFASVAQAVTSIASKGAAQSSHTGASKQSTTSKAVARETLRDMLEQISFTARGMAISTPGLEDKFRMPRGTGDQPLLNAARAFAADAPEFRDEFIRHELGENFIEDLNAAITAFEIRFTEKNRSSDAKVAATAGIEAGLEQALKAVRQLNVIVRNKFRNDEAMLAAWRSASHVERNPRRAAAPNPPAPTPTGNEPPIQG